MGDRNGFLSPGIFRDFGRVSGNKKKRKTGDFPSICTTSDAAEASLFGGTKDAVAENGSVHRPAEANLLQGKKRNRKKRNKKNLQNDTKFGVSEEGSQAVELSNTCYLGDVSLEPDAAIEMEKKSLLEWVEMDVKSKAAGSRTVTVSNGCDLVDSEMARTDKFCVYHEGAALGATLRGCNGLAESKKRKRENDRVLRYVVKRSVVVSPSPISKSVSHTLRTVQTGVNALGKRISVTITSEASAIQEWIRGQSGDIFGLDVEWRPNRGKGLANKVALLQLCGENECLIIQMLFLDRKPEALTEFLFNPLKCLAGVGVHSDLKRLLKDHGLVCQGGIELTTLAVERLEREELKHVGLKALVHEILGLDMKKTKRVTLSDWAKFKLDRSQVEYACIDAWVSFALSQKLLAER